jgi:hypothetical protein
MRQKNKGRANIAATVKMLLLAFLTLSIPTTPGYVAPETSVKAQGNSRTFTETGKTVRGIFLDYWDAHGGLAQQGFPISEEMQEKSDTDGKTYKVQYFERAVFEAHPENTPPNDVLLSLLGNFLYKQKYPGGAPGQTANNSPGSRLFTETGKRVGGRFLEYWQSHGGLAQQGLPISDEFNEKSDLDGKTYKVQYFERAVFELHTENQAPYDVLLSQLGTFRYKAKYTNPQNAPTPGTGPYTGPAARAGHDLVYDDVRKIVLMLNAGDVAGETEGSPTRLWAWDGHAWKVLSSDGPPIRSLGGAAFDARRGVLVMHGGVTNNFNYGDTWEWNGVRWDKKTTTPSPGFRHHFLMSYDAERAQVVAYGGNLQADETAQSQLTFPTDTWTWDGQTWKQAATTGLGIRYHYAMTYDSARKAPLIFGGSSRSSNHNDLWSWDGSKWTELTSSEARPSARLAPAMAYDESRGKTLLFGGRIGNTVLNDTWEWDGSKWTRLEISGSIPPARSHHAMTYDKSRRKIVMFGGIAAGRDDNYIADTWEWDGTNWAKVAGP